MLLSARAEAQRRGVRHDQVLAERRLLPLPAGQRVLGRDGARTWPARALTPTARAERDAAIRAAVAAGVKQDVIAEHLGISKGTVSQIAAGVPGRRRRGALGRKKVALDSTLTAEWGLRR
ncbi:hypothetical protein A5686_06410 [Mycobacterium sp. E2479]|nr:hypothetical protein A5686_06410 [Mycobacterium sp. E2479]